MELEYKSAAAEFKASKNEGEYEGYFAITGNADDGGDVIEPGAFKKTLTELGRKVRVLFGHDPMQLAGPPPTELIEDSKGLLARGRLTLDSIAGKNIWALMKDGALDEGSIGYRSVPARTEWKAGLRHLFEVKLFEISFVSMGMNPETYIRAMKALKSWNGSDGQPGNITLFLSVLREAIPGLQEVINTGGVDPALLDDVIDVTGIVQSALWGLLDEARPGAIGYMGLTPTSIKTLLAAQAEVKAGRMISGQNLTTLTTARDSMSTALTTLQDLIDAATPSEKAAHLAPPDVLRLRERAALLGQAQRIL